MGNGFAGARTPTSQPFPIYVVIAPGVRHVPFLDNWRTGTDPVLALPGLEKLQMNGLCCLAAVGVMFTSASAFAQDLAHVNCESNIVAVGVSSHVEGGLDFERYEGQVPPGLARARAIENWSLQIANACPAYSARWWRARAARVDCEGTLGHENCTATARPARKLLSYLLPY